MIHYTFYQKKPSSHYVDIDILIDAVSSDTLKLQLPAWRPGRYELGNFARNVKRVEMYNEQGEVVNFQKLSKDLWEVDTKNCSVLRVAYSYFAAELNAGACYADERQLYINPVHCCMYVEGRMQELHQVTVEVPENYKIACSLKANGHLLIANDYEELVDSPFIASEEIKTEIYTVNTTKFYIHFNGECRPDFEKIKKDFSAFTSKMLEFWGDCPTDEYHFLFQILPFRFYHGVEHKKSTVIAIGPGYAINSGDTYEDILGVSCHELFHTWNIKTIRPVEMMPYDYTRENYARTGYVYEGFTTYYGDKLLLGSGVFSVQQYFETLQERLTKHFDNFGRYNLSVADSSWETWLDGYVPGVPYRKTSIYDEGSLIAFMLDVKILQATGLKKSLRDVCALLYERFGKTGMGYTEQQVMELVNEVSGHDLNAFFKTYVYDATDYSVPLQECFDAIGVELIREPSPHAHEHYFGFKSVDNGHFSKVTLVAPHSQAWKAGLCAGDEIMSVNYVMLKSNFSQWMNYFHGKQEIYLIVNSSERLKTIILQKDKEEATWFFNPVLKLKEGPDAIAAETFKAWQKL